MFRLYIYEYDSQNEKWKTFRTFGVDTISEAEEINNLFAVAFNRVGVKTSCEVYTFCEDWGLEFEGEI